MSEPAKSNDVATTTTTTLIDVACGHCRDVLALAALHVPADPAEQVLLAGYVERARMTLARLEPLRDRCV